MYWHVPTKCLWFKMVQGCKGSSKKSINHKTTPVQYTFWWLRPLNLFWIHTLPLPHISPWCISSPLFYNPWKEFRRALWKSCSTGQRIQCGHGAKGCWKTKQAESYYFIPQGNSLNTPPCVFALSANRDILLSSIWCPNQLNPLTISISFTPLYFTEPRWRVWKVAVDGSIDPMMPNMPALH